MLWELTVVICGCLLLLLYLLYRQLWRPLSILSEIGVKGPRPETFFGNVRMMRKMGLTAFIDKLLKDYGPITGFYLGTLPFIVTSDREIIKQVMVKEFDSFADRPDLIALRPKELKLGLIRSRGEQWKFSRKTLSPTFSAAKMRMMVPLIEKSVKELVKRMGKISDSNKSENVHKIFGDFTMETIIATAYGRVIDIQGGESDELTEATAEIFRASSGNATVLVRMIRDQFPFLIPLAYYCLRNHPSITAFRLLNKVAIALVEERRRSNQQQNYKDYLQLLIDTGGEDEDSGCPVANGKLTNEQIVGFSVGFLLAGFETTANTLAFTAYLLALNPHIQEKLQQEIDTYMDNHPDCNLYDACHEIVYLDMVFNESLRVFPTATRTSRECQKTTCINGLTIPKGVCVMIPMAQLNKSPDYWEDPDVFDPERFSAERKAKIPPYCFMPFGQGPRNCIGMRFAVMEAKIALIEILKRFSFMRSPDTEVPLQTVVGITMAPKNGVYLKVMPRK